jgi:serpin B
MRVSRFRRVGQLLPVLGLAVLVAGTIGAKGGADAMATVDLKQAATVVEGNTRFALDLYARVRGEPGNLFFSPCSISSALAMTCAGARGDTARQMAAVLHLEPRDDRLHAAFHALIDHINGKDAPAPRQYQLDTANALWGDQGDTFLATFLDLTRANYGAGLRQVDFRHDPGAARATINAWVEEQTHDKIRDLLEPRDVTPDTSLVLTNAIYFKGDWARPFAPSMTDEKAVFHAPGGRDVTAPLMRQTAAFTYHDGGTFQLLELPYAGEALAMVVLLPNDVNGLPALEQSLSPSKLAAWLGATSHPQVAVALPRFKLTVPLRLAPVLRAMGMTLAFDPSQADFSGMNGRRDLTISEVVHKAMVDVNEKGTEAAAATAVLIPRSLGAVRPKIISFCADHPFLFLIRDRATGSVLFLGRVVDPRA